MAIVATVACGVAFAQPLANLSRTGIDWGSVNAGFPNDSQPIVITNTGNAPLTLNRLTVSGNPIAPFFIGGTCRPGSVLPPNGRCRIDVGLYLANPLDLADGVLTVHSDGVPPEVEVALHATSVGPTDPIYRAPNLAPDWIDFDPQAVGAPATVRSMTVRNDGPVPWRVRNLSLVGGDYTDFTLATDCIGLTLRTGDACTVDVGFLPAGAGPRSTQLLLEFREMAITFRSITGRGGPGASAASAADAGAN